FANLCAACLVDIAPDFDSYRLELAARRVLQLERFFRFLRGDVAARFEYPLLLLVAEALPELVADPDDGIVCLVLGHRKHRSGLVVLVDEIDVDRVLADTDDAS